MAGYESIDCRFSKSKIEQMWGIKGKTIPVVIGPRVTQNRKNKKRQIHLILSKALSINYVPTTFNGGCISLNYGVKLKEITVMMMTMLKIPSSYPRQYFITKMLVGLRK